ncbi:MAG: BNR-4 repeat-containing protein, partial [Chitinophagaceae bacterium]|nr:BNR-4 repeat-containing protein [Chitinophagaceae bacterium]
MKKQFVATVSICLIVTCFAEKCTAQTPPASAYKVAAPDGAWCWFSDPRAVYHRGKTERIYYAYINSIGDVMISAMDVKTKKIQTAILHNKLEIDDHNVPAILFLPNGKILTFYSEHGGRFFIRKSR